jgi:hypothetical protein
VGTPRRPAYHAVAVARGRVAAILRLVRASGGQDGDEHEYEPDENDDEKE